MKRTNLEYIKVICLIVITVSLTILAWNTFIQVNLLEEIQEHLYQIGNKISKLKDN